MQVVCIASTPRTDESIRENEIKMLLDNGWVLVGTEPAPYDPKNTKYIIGWPEDKGKAVLPKGFKKLKILEI